MKRICMIVLMALFCIGVCAQEEEESKKKTTWYVKLGGTFATLTGWEDEDIDNSSKMGYLVGIAFDRAVGTKGWFIGAGLQLRSKGGKTESYWYQDVSDGGASWTDREHNDCTYNINTIEIPLYFGYKFHITDNWSVDLRIGGFANYDLWGNMKKKTYGWYDGKSYDNGETKTNMGDWEDYDSYSAGALAGLGVWYKKFNLNLTYEFGLLEQFGEAGGKERNWLLTFGYAF